MATGIASAALLLVLVLAGCDQDSPVMQSPPQPTSLTIDCGPGICQMEVGSQRALIAFAISSDGSHRPEQVIWMTEDAAVASVDDEGFVRAMSSGATFIRATAGSLSAGLYVLIRPRSIGSWRGEYIPQSCTVTGSFEFKSWCPGFYDLGARFIFGLSLGEENGKLTGAIEIDKSGGGLIVDAGSSLDANGQLLLSARGEAGLAFMGPFRAVIGPFRADMRGDALEGNFILTVIGAPGSGLSGSVVVEARLNGVNRR